jgi:MFS family permease
VTVENRRRAIATVFTVVFVDLLGFGILIPVIPLYARSFGADEFTASLLIAAFSVFQFAFAPILGRISDRRGRRPVLLVSLFGSTIAWTLFGLAEALWVLFLARIVAGAMGGNIATAQAYIADITPPEDRARGLGFLGAAFGLGFVFGPALGGVFSSAPVVAAVDGALPAAVPITEFSLPSFVAAAITGANLVAAVFVLPESNPPEKRDEEAVEAGPETGGFLAGVGERLDDLLGALSTRGLGTLVIAFFVASFAFSALESQFVFFSKDVYGYGPAANGYILGYVGVVIAVVQGGLIGPLVERFGEYRLAVVGAATQAATLGLVPFSPALAARVPDVGPFFGVLPTVGDDVLVLLAVMTVLSAGNALTNVTLNTLVSRSATEEDQGGAFGLTQSAGSLARVFGPATAGALYAGIDVWVPFAVAGALFLPVVVLLSRLERAIVVEDPGLAD